MNVLKVLFDGIHVGTLTSMRFVEKGGKKKKTNDAIYVSICSISVALLPANFFNRIIFVN